MTDSRDVPVASDGTELAGDTGLDVVTGAFGYSGARIARRLLEAGRAVRTLTMHPRRAAEGHPVETHPLDFGDPAGLARSMEGATTLYSTYWVRFARGGMNHELAAANCRALFQAAERAGVRRVVHTSVLHASLESPYPYFRGKALAERALAETGLPHAVLRPSMLFDEEGILINNTAWMLRRLPVFGVGGSGTYRVRPIHVDDLALLAIQAASWSGDSIVDAVGPERPTFLEFINQIRDAVGSRARIVRVPAPVLLGMSRVLGAAMHDVILTREEYETTALGLADSEAPSTGSIALSTWLLDHGMLLGLTYAGAAT